MRGLTHRWIEPKDGSARESIWPGFSLEPLAARVLRARGFSDEASARSFCEPRLSGMHDPASLPGVERAAQRIVEALRAGERVAIYGDYDVDGICASAILYHAMALMAPDAVRRGHVTTYVPHRIDEGYGLNGDALETLAGQGVRVVVSVDCGITAFEAARRARVAGIDLIITDHHNPPDPSDGLPEAFEIVHPRLGDSAYPWGELAGAGVAFKLAWRLCTLAHGTDRLPDAWRTVLLDLLALAGLATIADIVPLLDENRIIARFGLQRLKSTQLAGVNALLEASDLAGQKIGPTEAGFMLGPRLNACGRMGHAAEAVELLTTASPERAAEIAGALNRLNRQRQSTERAIFEQAAEQAESAGMTGDGRRGIVLADPGWHAGVVGIVCSRLVGRYCRPALLFQRNDGFCKGSGRSVEGWNLHAALTVCSEHIEQFGGHDMAAGMTIAHDRFDRFAQAFLDHADRTISDDFLLPSLAVDCEAALSEFTVGALQQIESMGPFGRSNPAPNILVRRVRIARHPEPLGRQGRHLALQITDDSRRMLRLLGWGWGERIAHLHEGMHVDVTMRPSLNRWNGQVRIEPEMLDLRPV